MRLLFSGADHPMSPQTDRLKSLGGFMSSTPIPNGRPGALFSSISAYSQKNQFEETFAFFIFNETANDITDISLQQIYENILGINDNQAEFEWAVVQPNEENQIELIGNSREIPYYADFFSPTTKRENCVLKITTAAISGETFTILGENITLIGDGIEDMIDEIVMHFAPIDTYRVEKYSNNSVFIERSELIETNDPVELTTTGSGVSNVVNFDGFIDGETILIDTLEPQASIGVWIKRKVLLPERTDCSELEVIEEPLDTEECLEVIISYQ